MKSNQFFSGIALVGLAASVTAGSMYVSLSASSQQETLIGQDNAVSQAENASKLELVVEDVAKSMDQPLAPDQVIHSRSHEVVLDADGAFSGKLSTVASGADATVVAGVTVKVIRDGVEAGKAVTNDQGDFLIRGLKPGVVAFLAYGENSFMLYGINLVASDEKHPAANQIDVDSAVVSGADLGIVQKLIGSKLPKADLRFEQAAGDEDQKFPYGEGEMATSVIGHRVQLQKDGRLRGVINLLDARTGRNREILDLTVYFVREGKIVGKAEVENNGEFIVAGLFSGAYSVVGVGKDGAFALGIEVIGSEEGEEVARGGFSEYRTVAAMASLELSVAAANAGNFNSANSAALTGGGVTSEATPPGTGGGGTGGGAGGGGGGGLGALLGGAIGAGAGFLAGQNSQPVSP